MAEMQNMVCENTERKIKDYARFCAESKFFTESDYKRAKAAYKLGQTDIVISLLDDIAESLRVLSGRDDM